MKQKEIKKTFYEWYGELWSANSAFCISEPIKENKNRKITRKDFEEYKK